MIPASSFDQQAARMMVLKSRPLARLSLPLNPSTFALAVSRFRELYKTDPTWMGCHQSVRGTALRVLVELAIVQADRTFRSPFKHIVDDSLPMGAWYLLASPSQIVYSETPPETIVPKGRFV